MDGQLSSDALPELIELAARHDTYLEEQLKTNLVRKWGLRLFHHLRRNSKDGSAKNIAHHYDLGNNFYQAWLDPTMTYSSAVFDSDDDDLTTAQINKYKRLAALADIQPGDQVLEIGCGWGAFAKYITSEIGATVTGITISKEQFAFANHMLGEAGLGDKVDLRLMDYRDLEGRFDKIVSIEMFEAVGKDYWPTYFAIMSKVLKRGGRAVIQSITIDHAAYHSYANQPDFIQRYIFPGGMLPSPNRFTRIADQAGLACLDVHHFGWSYAQTLKRWQHNFGGVENDVRDLGFDTDFIRLWHFYFSYCISGFDSGRTGVGQYTLQAATS